MACPEGAPGCPGHNPNNLITPTMCGACRVQTQKLSAMRQQGRIYGTQPPAPTLVPPALPPRPPLGGLPNPGPQTAPPLPPRPVPRGMPVPSASPGPSDLQGQLAAQAQVMSAQISQVRGAKVLEVDEQLQETISNANPNNWNGSYTIHAKFSMQIVGKDLIVLLKLKVPQNFRFGSSAVDAQNVWRSNIEKAWSGCTLHWRPTQGPPETFQIILQIHLLDGSAQDFHHVIQSQHPDAPDARDTRGLGGTTSQTGWGTSDSVDVTHEVGHMLGNPENYFSVDFQGRHVDWGQPRQRGKGIMNNPAEPPLAEHFWLVRQKFPTLMALNGKTGMVVDVIAPKFRS